MDAPVGRGQMVAWLGTTVPLRHDDETDAKSIETAPPHTRAAPRRYTAIDNTFFGTILSFVVVACGCYCWATRMCVVVVLPESCDEAAASDVVHSWLLIP